MATLSIDSLEAVLVALGIENRIPPFPDADLLRDPMGIFVSYLAGTLAALTQTELNAAFGAIQWPSDEGDLNIILPKLRLKNVNTKILASELIFKFPASPLYASPFNESHTLRFFLNPETLASILLSYIIDRGPHYGTDKEASLTELKASSWKARRIVVEFSSPNLGQEFNSDHLRSTVIGTFIASIYEAMGWDVVKMNFLGDWGKHIGLLAIGWAKFHLAELYAENPLSHLLDIYTKTEDLLKGEKKLMEEEPSGDPPREQPESIDRQRDDFFRRMESGDSHVLDLWNKLSEACVSHYTGLYARLGIQFDEQSGESKFGPETAAVVDRLLQDKILRREEDGASVIDFETHGHKNLGSPKIRYPDGTTTYLFRDIAAVLERNKQYSFEKMIYVVSSKQDSHFQQLTGALILMGHEDLAGKLQHVSFGKTQGLAPEAAASGLLLSDVLDRCQQEFSKFLEKHHGDLDMSQGPDISKVADSLAGIGLMTQQGLVKRGAIYNFDLDDMANLNPYNGLMLQCWLSKIRFQKLKGITIPREALAQADYSFFGQAEHEAFADVLRLLVQFPGIVKQSFRTLESSHILMLLFRITDILPDVWAADSDNQEQQGESVKEEPVNVGPSDAKEAGPMDYRDTTDETQDTEDGFSDSTPTKEFSDAPEAVGNDSSATITLVAARGDGPPYEEKDTEADHMPHGETKDTSVHSDTPALTEGTEGNLETLSSNEGGKNPQDNERAVQLSVQDPPRQAEASVTESQSAAEGDGNEVEEQPLTQNLNDEDPKEEITNFGVIQGRQARDSGIFLGGAEAAEKASFKEKPTHNAAVDENIDLEPETSLGPGGLDSDGCPKGDEVQALADKEAGSAPTAILTEENESTSKDADIPGADTTAEQGAQGPIEEAPATSEAETRERGKGKEKRAQAYTNPQISSERLVKLAFYECVRQVLENGMRMVGIVPLKM